MTNKYQKQQMCSQSYNQQQKKPFRTTKVQINVLKRMDLLQVHSLISQSRIFCQSTAISLISAMLCLANGTMRAASVLHHTLLHGLLKAPMAFFMTTPTGRLIARFSNDIDTLDYKLPMHTKLSLIQSFRVCDGVVW